MQKEFDVVLSSIHPITISIPKLGEINLPAQVELQLLNASIDVVNYLRNTFTNTGVSFTLNKKSKTPYRVFDYLESEPEDNKQKVLEQNKPLKSPLEKAGDFVLPSGKHKGKKVKDIKDDSLRQISKMTKNQTVKSTIDAYLILKESR